MRFLKGVIQTEAGRPADAIATFTKLTEDYPELPEPYNNLAVLYAGQSQFDKARAALEMAIRTNPSYATAHENLGDVYAKLASQAYSKALQLDAGNTGVQPKLALIRELFAAAAAKAPRRAASGTRRAAPAPAPAPAVAARPRRRHRHRPPAVAAAPAPAPAGRPAAAAPRRHRGGCRPPPRRRGRPAAAKDVEAAVQAWAAAWAAKDMGGYLGAYGKEFDPPGKMSRKAWEDERRARIVGKSQHQRAAVGPARLGQRQQGHGQVQAGLQRRQLNVSSRKTSTWSRPATAGSSSGKAPAPEAGMAGAAEVEQFEPLPGLPRHATASLPGLLRRAASPPAPPARRRQRGRRRRPPSRGAQQRARGRAPGARRRSRGAADRDLQADRPGAGARGPGQGRSAGARPSQFPAGPAGLRRPADGAGAAGEAFGDVPDSAASSRRQMLAELREESQLRMRALRERPPAGAIPAQFLQLSPRNKHAIAIDTSRARLYLFENTPTGLKLLADYYISVGKLGHREGRRRRPAHAAGRLLRHQQPRPEVAQGLLRRRRAADQLPEPVRRAARQDRQRHLAARHAAGPVRARAQGHRRLRGAGQPRPAAHHPHRRGPHHAGGHRPEPAAGCAPQSGPAGQPHASPTRCRPGAAPRPAATSTAC